MKLSDVLENVTDIATLKVNKELMIDENADVSVYPARPYMINLISSDRGSVLELEVELDRGGGVKLQGSEAPLLYIIYPMNWAYIAKP
tara:strand:+ start:3238 stop:3501 length:264 start_codon:yes stop_codon:yes gene_type:complete